MSSIEVILFIVFGSGVLFQALFQVKDNLTIKNFLSILGCLGISILAFMPGKHEYQYDLSTHILMYFGFFSFTYAFALKDKIIKILDEKTLLFFNIIFIYTLLTNQNSVNWLILLLGIIPTLIVIFNCFVNIQMGFLTKVFLYIWYFVMCIVIGLAQFNIGDFTNFLSAGTVHSDLLNLFLSGMTFNYLVVNAAFIYELIPLPGKHQSFQEKWKQVVADSKLLASRFSDDQTGAFITMIILFLFPALLYINYQSKLIPDYILINALVGIFIVFELLLYKIKQGKIIFTFTTKDQPITKS